jgi:hypothetical protein
MTIIFFTVLVPRLDEVSPAYQFVMTLRLLLLGAEQRDMVGLLQDHSHSLTQVTVSWDSK